MRVILHIDMDAYFASIEQAENPFLRGKPLVVVADPHRRSVVLTASYEARAFGLRTGMILWQAKALCPHVEVVAGDSEKYMAASRKILGVLKRFSDQVEMMSCDEAFLDVTESRSLFGDGAAIAKAIKTQVHQALSLTCSIGVAPNKLLAKLASEQQKPDGLTVFAPEKIPELLEKIPVEALCGIGRKTREALARLGIKTCGELGRSPLWVLHHHFGFWAHLLKRMGQGEDSTPVSRVDDAVMIKSIGHSHTLPKDTEDREILSSFLELLSEKVAARLRRKHLAGRSIALTIRYADFHTFTRHMTLKHATDERIVIHQAAQSLFRAQEPLPQAIRLLGVSVSELEGAQEAIWLFESLAKRAQAARTADDINACYGPFTIKPARVLVAERFGVLETPIPPRLSS